MKIRNGFVSNSSSSSFICNICGRTETGWDICLDDAEMCQCTNGHCICTDERINIEEWTEEDETYDMNIKFCPICQFLEASHYSLGKYLEKTTDITKEQVFEEIKKVNKRRKKLHDNEYTEYVCVKTGTTIQDILKQLKKKFKTYDKFLEFIHKK